MIKADLPFRSLDGTWQARQLTAEPDRYRQLRQYILSAGHIIPAGSRLSYAPLAACPDGLTLSLRNFDRLLDFSPEEFRITVEAGITLGELYRFLLPRRLCLRVQPGYPDITIGGCIAANVHGKNQYRDGQFIDCIEELDILLANGETVTASRQKNPELFNYTIGGFGLTGLVLSARLVLAELSGQSVHQQTEHIRSFPDAIARIQELAARHDYAYAWHDCASPWSPRWGESLVFYGDVASVSSEDSIYVSSHRTRPGKARFRLPVFQYQFPNRIINAVYIRQQTAGSSRILPLHQAFWPTLGKEFYFSWYGRKGFVEMQALVPLDRVQDYLQELQGAQQKYGVAVGLAASKFFRGKPHHISYGGAGISFSLDIANNSSTLPFMDCLDDLHTALGARSNIAKDSRLSRKVFDSQYRDADAARAVFRSMDPDRRFISSLSERLGLK
ncbi:MAG: FAD-binding oxidoreductase [Pseudomonadota bacterium]|nr:FAD-binding oxidoreductase [Pseudomonadota bacterium]